MSHGKNDGADAGSRSVTCGDCIQPFHGKTRQEAADACKRHVDAGCPKARVSRPVAGVDGTAAAFEARHTSGALQARR